MNSISVRSKAVVKILTALTLATCVGGCAPKTKRVTIHFVVPTGYNGIFVIRTNRSDGTRMTEQDGRFVCPVPEDGIVSINGKGPFYDWHVRTASYENGQIILSGDEGIENEDSIGLWFLLSRDDETIWYIIGTRKAKEEALRKNPSKLVAGNVVGKGSKSE